MMAFDSFGILLFDRHVGPEATPIAAADNQRCAASTLNQKDDTVNLSVSQMGDVNRGDEYMRLRNAPEMPPLEAIRESNLLHLLIEDYANPDVSMLDSNNWIKYANLLVLLTVTSPYELLYFHYDEHACRVIKSLPQREVWKQFFLPPPEVRT